MSRSAVRMMHRLRFGCGWSSNAVVVAIVPPPLIWRRPVAQGLQQVHAFPACNAVAYAPNHRPVHAHLSAPPAVHPAAGSVPGWRMGWRRCDVTQHLVCPHIRQDATAHPANGTPRAETPPSLWDVHGPGVAASASRFSFRCSCYSLTFRVRPGLLRPVSRCFR